MNLQMRYAGALYGAAAADAVCATFEGCMPDDTREPALTGGGQFSLAPGEVTDDTLMMLALAESRLQTGTFSSAAFASKVIATVRDRPKTFGRTTRTFAQLSEMGCDPDRAAVAVDMLYGSTTNGSVMRTLPTALFAASADEAEYLGRTVSAYTHVSKTACDAAGTLSRALYRLLHGETKETVVADVPAVYLGGQLIPSVNAEESLRCAFCIFRDSSSYLEILTMACRLGGDSDTIGAMAGALGGAWYGIDAVPAKWCAALDVHDRIETVLKSLK